MENTRTGELLLLSLGLCLIFFHVNATNSAFDRYAAMDRRLQLLRERQAKLEQDSRNAPLPLKLRIEADLIGLRNTISSLEASLVVPYNEHRQSISEERRNFERERAVFRRRLAQAENMRIQFSNALTLQEKENSDQIGYYQEELEKLTNQRNKIAREYAKFTDAFYEEEQKTKEERDQFLAKQGQLQQTLDDAKKKHAQALEAMTDTPAESYRPYSIPEQDEINKLRIDITAFNGLKDRKQLKEGLGKTSNSLKELLDKLYEKGKFSTETSREDLQNAFSEMKTKTILQREEQDNLRKELVEKMKKKDLTSYSDEELVSLQKTNKEVAALDEFQKEIERKSAYLKGILEVSDLLKECSNAIRDANERNLANMWADGIQEAKDSPLAKTWAKAVQDAKDSDFVKAWAEAIQNANSNIAKAWTDAIRDIKDSRVAKMWGDAMKNIQESPFGKCFGKSLGDAKNTLSKINSKK